MERRSTPLSTGAPRQAFEFCHESFRWTACLSYVVFAHSLKYSYLGCSFIVTLCQGKIVAIFIYFHLYRWPSIYSLYSALFRSVSSLSYLIYVQSCASFRTFPIIQHNTKLIHLQTYIVRKSITCIKLI